MPVVTDDDDQHEERTVWFEGWAQLSRALAPRLARLKKTMGGPPTDDGVGIGDGAGDGVGDENLPEESVDWYGDWPPLGASAASLLARFKRSLVRRPTLWFFTIAVVPPIVSVQLGQRWINDVTTCSLLGAALLVTWASHVREDASTPGSAGVRAAVFLVSANVIVLLSSLQTWAVAKQFRYLGLSIERNSGVGEFVDLYRPFSLLHDIVAYLTAWQNIPRLAIMAWAASSVVSPAGCLHRVLTPADWRAPRSRYVFAAAALPATALVFAIGALIFAGHPQGSDSSWSHVTSGYALLTLPWLAVSSVFGAIAWFGVGGRLVLARHAPIVAAVAIWVAQSAMSWSVTMRVGLGPMGSLEYIELSLGGLALAAAAVWVFGHSGRWLGPVAVLTTASAFTSGRVVWFIARWPDNDQGLMIAYSSLICLVGLAVAWWGGLLRRPEGTGAGPAPADAV
jgi:hypothetical protein